MQKTTKSLRAPKDAGEHRTTILERIADGDQRGVQDCMDQYSGLVWSTAKRLIGDTDDTEDAVQEVFIEIWRNAGRFDPAKGTEITFISMIIRRRLIDRLRRKVRQPDMQELDDGLFRTNQNPEKEMQIRLEAKRAQQVMNRFQPNQRKAIEFAIDDGLTHPEIADALGLPLGTVKTLIRRGFQRVRRDMQRRTFPRIVTT